MKLLFLTPRFPFPPHKGDALRVYHQIRALSSDHRITLLSMTDRPVASGDAAEVKKLCERVEVVELSLAKSLLNLCAGLWTKEPLQVRYYHSAAFQDQLHQTLSKEKFDAIHVTLLRMLPYVQGIKDVPVVVDLIDSLTLNLDSRRQQLAGIRRWAYDLEFQRVRAYETNVVSHLPNLVVSSPADGELFERSTVKVIPNGVDMERFTFHGAGGRSPQTLVFTGNMGYQPNEEAVHWFASEVWPELRTKRPRLRFQVVGTRPSLRVRALAGTDLGIEVTGEVPDVRTYLCSATLAVAPMRSGSGIQNKVLEAMACGAPVVASSLANRGVNAVHQRDLLIADDAAATATEIERLLERAELRSSLADAGRHFVEMHYRWESHAGQLAKLYTLPLVTGNGPAVVSQTKDEAVVR